MAKIDKKYHKLLNKILTNGVEYDDPNRKDTQRIQIPHYSFKHNLKEGFPAIATKDLYWKGIVGELLWFLRGETSPKYLIDNKITIWNKDGVNFLNKQTGDNMTVEEYTQQIKDGNLIGDLGRIYGAQWRDWSSTAQDREEGLDQISKLIKDLKNNPLSSSHIVTAWNPAELNNMALPPCHKGFQIMAYPLSENYSGHIVDFGKEAFSDKTKVWESPKYGFDLVWEQRSCDVFLGIPFNIASYALLAHIIGSMVNMVPGNIVGDLRNVHIYKPHMDAVKEQLGRDVNKYQNCEFEINETTSKILKGDKSLDEKLSFLNISDFKLKDYQSYPKIKAEMLAYKK